MALNATQIVAAINTAGFTEEEYNLSQKVQKLQAELILVEATIANDSAWLAEKNAEFQAKLDVEQQKAAAIKAQINALASPVK